MKRGWQARAEMRVSAAGVALARCVWEAAPYGITESWGVGWSSRHCERWRSNPETEAGMIGVLLRWLDCRVGCASSQ